MCNEIATSREHIPPLCFFPEKSNFPYGLDLRRNLITVPSCQEHNLSKSDDDEYLLAVATTHIENNPIAQHLFRTKVLKAMKRRPYLIPAFFKNMFPVRVGGKDTAGFHIDRTRFDRSFDHMSRGVYFHHFGKRIKFPSALMSYSMADVSSPKKDEINIALDEWREFSTNALANMPKYGENPAVYYYHVLEDDETESVAIRHVFFEGVVVDVLFDPKLELVNS